MIMAFYNCRVKSAGAGHDNEVRIRLENMGAPDFDHNFFAIPSQRREMLATALTAITTGLPVNAQLDSTVENETIMNLAIIRD
jgi:hypothetical protein